MPIAIRRKAKNILEGSINAALLAVEIYNKPRATFRTESFITLMIIAWNRLFHSYFYKVIGDRYYYKKNNKYIRVNGDKKAWNLRDSLNKFIKISKSIKISEATKQNLDFFIGWRNRIEHTHVDSSFIDTIAFGACQALLINYENLIRQLYGDSFAINENLRFSLQFSYLRDEKQKIANKSNLSKEASNLKKYINDFRDNLPENIYNSPEFSFKVLLVPKISNTNKNDLEVEFVKFNANDSKDKAKYDEIVNVINKDVIKFRDVVNLNKFKPKAVCKEVEKITKRNFNCYDHNCFCFVFSIKLVNKEKQLDPTKTNTNFCLYDDLHKDYSYNQNWVDFISILILEKNINIEN